MFTELITKEGKLTFQTQQYKVGLYVIINNDASKQFCVNDNEDMFHKKLRLKALKAGDTIANGTILSIKSSSPINTFHPAITTTPQ